METKMPKANLWTYTQYPLETVYCLWNRSKDKNFKMTPEEVHMRCRYGMTGDTVGGDPDWELEHEVEEVFKKVIAQNIPIGENIWFTFMIEDDPIAHREQMVRHRLGVKFGDNFGVDIIPDINHSTWWSQSMRIMDYSKFAQDEMYFVPESFKNHPDPQVLSDYHQIMMNIQAFYSGFVNKGIPMEDARGVLPLHSTMDISWSLHLNALIHILGKRSCWILQYGLWGHIISSMVDELVSKIHPVFRQIVQPPCFQDGKFNECVYKFENERRVTGDDKLPVCPLYEHHDLSELSELYAEKYPDMKKRQLELVPKYSKLWGVDAFTGK